MTEHEKFMQLALENARATKGQTAPNPQVGAVLVKDGRIIGIGAHLKPGEPHAEIHALRMAGEKALGATAYVTLEPCSHHGRTGPCAEALIQAGVKRVVIAALDPNPLVSGRGIALLENARIEVIQGICEQESTQMNEVFNKYIVTKRPFVTLKAASTLDGKIATHTGSSKWITSEAAREDVHQLRHVNQAILVGVQTVIADDPQLNTRLPGGRSPIRVVLDSTLRIPEHARMLDDGQAPVYIFAGAHASLSRKQQLEDRGAKVFITQGERPELTEVLDILGGLEISSLLVEGGGEVHASFISQGLADKLVLYIAPKLVGGASAPGFIGGAGVSLMDEAILLQDMTVEMLGPDLKLEGYFSVR